MKKLQLIKIISTVVLILTLLVLIVNILQPLSDWIVRVDGIIMLIALGGISYSTVKGGKGK